MNRASVIALIFLLLALPASAQDPFGVERMREVFAQRQSLLDRYSQHPQIDTVIAPDGQPFASFSVGLSPLISARGQSLLDFLSRRGDELRAVSADTGWEVCARVCLSPDNRYGLLPTTNRAALFCVASADLCPPGFSDTTQNVHTHVGGMAVVRTPIDLALYPEANQVFIPEDSSALSSVDLAVPGTWLLAPDGSVKSNE